MRTVEIIPKLIAIAPDGHEYSPYGSLIEGSKIVERGYTWRTNENGSISIGLGRKPVKTIDEAIEVVKNLEKLGYKNLGYSRV